MEMAVLQPARYKTSIFVLRPAIPALQPASIEAQSWILLLQIHKKLLLKIKVFSSSVLTLRFLCLISSTLWIIFTSPSMTLLIRLLSGPIVMVRQPFMSITK